LAIEFHDEGHHKSRDFIPARYIIGPLVALGPMKSSPRRIAQTIVCLLAVVVCARLFAGDGKEVLSSEDPTPSIEPTPQLRFSAEYNIEETYIGDSEVARGRHHVDDFDESNTVVSFVFTPRVSFGILRLGAGYERYSFGLENGWPLPNTLQAANLVVGLDTQFSDSILFRIEAQPGIYGAGMDDLEWDDANIPFLVGGTYIYSPDLQFVLGVGVDVNRKYPVVPGGGIRWKMASQWVLNAVLPTPRLEFEATPQFVLHVGAVIKNQTFRMSDELGTAGGRPELDQAVLNYTEVRTGFGFDWKITRAVTLSTEGGYLPYREFDFHRTEVRYHHEKGAPYGTIALHGSF
jgi:Domain of unknown function (DUF6268)